MKRILAIVLMLVLVLALYPVNTKAATVTINVYNWGQYISDGTDDYIDVIAEFEAAYPNIKVNYMTFDSNESMYTKLVTGGSSYDVIIPSDYMVQKLIAEDMLLPLDFDNIPNYQYIDEGFRNMAYDPDNLYSVPYTWGCVGIIYNTKYVDEADATGWDLLWNTKYAGQILMFNNPRDSFAIAELKLGYSINTEDETELAECAKLLEEQKGLVQSYVMDEVFGKMERGEAWIAPYYAGDYLTMVEENEDLAFCFPEEGFNLFVDALCIPVSCQHKTEAELFINFVTSPEVCGPNLEYLGYSVPLSAAKEYMDESVTESDIAYPDDEILARGTAFTTLSTEGNQLMNDLWLSVKTNNTSTIVYSIMTIAAIALAIFFSVFMKVRKRRKMARRCLKWKNS